MYKYVVAILHTMIVLYFIIILLKSQILFNKIVGMCLQYGLFNTHKCNIVTDLVTSIKQMFSGE